MSALADKAKKFCIVGSGPGATILAIELAKRTCAQVTVVDVDDFSKPYSQAISSELESQSLGHPFNQNVTRGFGFGGSSNLWHGLVTKFDDEDLIAINDASGCDISSEIAACYESLDSYFPGLSKSFTKAESQKIKNGIFFKEFLSRDSFRAKSFLLQKKPMRSRSLLKDACARYRNIRIMDRSVALWIRPSDHKASLAEQLIIFRDKKIVEIEADVYIICAGGLESPRLLLQSIDHGFDSLRNHNIGRFLIDHPWAVIGELISQRGALRLDLTDNVLRGTNYSHRVGLRPPKSESILRNNCISFKPLYFGAYPRFKEALKSLIAMQPSLANVTTLFKSFSLRDIATCLSLLLCEKFGLGYYSAKALVFLYLDQGPAHDSKVSIGGVKDSYGRNIPEIRWLISDSDLDQALIMQNYIKSSLSDSKAFTYRPYHIDKDSFASGSHHAGTLRIGRSKDCGVIDNDLMVYGSENIYVCDLSIFPIFGNSNPTLTLCAFAFRLANHLSRGY